MNEFCVTHAEFYSNKEKNFDNIVKYISNKNTVLNHKNFLSYVYEDPTYSLANTKIFLTMYLLKYVSEEIVNISNDDSIEMIDKAGKLLGLFNMIVTKYGSENRINEDLASTFKRNFSLFITNYKKWKEDDISAFLYNAVVITHDMQLTISYLESKEDSDSDSDSMIELINKQIDDVHNHVISLNLDSRFIKEYNEYLIKQRILMMREEISEVAKNAFYECMEESINLKEFGILETFLGDLKLELRKILPKNQEFNKKINFEDSFDDQLIIQMIKNDAFDKEDFLKLFEYFFDLFMKIQPAEEDSDLIEWKETFLEEFYEKDFTKNIIAFLRYYMDKIETIQQKMIDFYNKLKEMSDSVD
jgi:hypothetical protein